MNLFVSYAFNEENRWIEELGMPLIKALGFQIVSGRRMDGQIIAQGVDERMRLCRGCIGFTTRRDALPNGRFGTHQWVLDELAIAKALKLPTIEIREDVVDVEGLANSFVQLRFTRAARDKLLVELAEALATWPTRLVRVRIQPPAKAVPKFRTMVFDGIECRYKVQVNGHWSEFRTVPIEPITAGFFVDLEVPLGDVIINLELRKDTTLVWRSLGSGVGSVPIEVFKVGRG